MALASVLAALGAAADAQTTPTLATQPSNALYDQYYPHNAYDLFLEGDAWVTCSADDAGVLSGCAKAHEWPLDFGFGDAAVKMVRHLKATGPGRLTIPIHFGLSMGTLTVCRSSDTDCILVEPLASTFSLPLPVPGSKPVSIYLRCRLSPDGAVAACGIPADSDPKLFNPAIDAAVKGYRFPHLPTGFNLGWTILPVNLIPADPDAAQWPRE